MDSAINSASIRAIRLDSWKGIAQYLRRSTRTVQRWHADFGLPVRHIGGISTSVFAFSDELENWLRNQSDAPSN